MQKPIAALSSTQLQQAVSAIAYDGIICYPTEGVWGLGCHPQSERAFAKLLQLKQRPADKGVILIAATMAQIRPYAQLDDTLCAQLSALWPGFVTCVLPKSPDCPDYLCGRHDTVAVRLSAYDYYVDAPLGGAAKPSRIVAWQLGQLVVLRD